jgi:hypothetical protein
MSRATHVSRRDEESESELSRKTFDIRAKIHRLKESMGSKGLHTEESEATVFHSRLQGSGTQSGWAKRF